MEVFGLTRLLFVLMSICYPPKGSSALVRYFYVFYTIFLVCVHALGFYGGVRFGLECGLENIEGSLDAISQIAGCINAAYTTFAAIFYRAHFTRTLDHYVELHKQGNNRFYFVESFFFVHYYAHIFAYAFQSFRI